MRKFFWLAVAAVAVGLAVLVLGVVPWPVQGGGESVEHAARVVARRVLTVDAHNQQGWKAAVYPLCTSEGKRFWDDNLANGMWESIAVQGVHTKAVDISSARVVAVEHSGDTSAAIVVVDGTVVYSTPRGDENTQPFQQTTLLERRKGAGWRFVAFLAQ